MTHLIVELYERAADRFPCCTLDDHDASNRQYFHDLQQHGSADRATRVVIRPGDEYHTGDHIRLLDRVSRSFAGTIALDPAIAGDVNLDEVLFDEQSFAARAEAVLFITNPNFDNSYRLRVSLYAQAGQRIPSLLLYDWEYPRSGYLADLERFHFANKTAFIRIEPGPAYHEGDRVILRDALATDSRTYVLAPGDYDLARLPVEESQAEPLVRSPRLWAESVAALELALQPRLIWPQ